MATLARVTPRDTRSAMALAWMETKSRLRARRRREAEPPPDVVDWAEANHYIADEAGLTQRIKLARHQAALLRCIFQPNPDGTFRFSSVVWSCPKKSGKTAIAAMVARWAAETWGRYGEVYCMANDLEQAKGRAFQAIEQSVALAPGYLPQRRALPGRWLVQDRAMRCLTSGATVKAVASDYKGEAGSNPSLTLWTELWGYVHEASRRLWVEMTPSPVRSTSMRWVETYAGFEGESELLEGLYNLGKEGRQLTAGELGDVGCFEEAPNPEDLVPVWVNEGAGLCMYWDEGEIARRMSWQRGEHGERYYRQQASELPPHQFNRLHLNRWSGGESEFVPTAWWDACLDPMGSPNGMPLVVAVDAGVSGDSTALVAVSRHPEHPDHVVLRQCQVWYAQQQPGGKMDYDITISPALDRLLAEYNVVQVAYDPYQLHQWAVNRRKTTTAWYREFNQGKERLEADKALFDIIRDKRLHQDGDPELRKHVQNANAKHQANEDSKLRLVKKAETRRIDAAVALSMAAAECLRLNL